MTIRVAYQDLLDLTAAVFAGRGVPATRAGVAAEALCHGDLTGVRSHGLANLTRLYLPLFDESGVDPSAELEVLRDTGACAVVNAHRALGLWAASEAMDRAACRAGTHGVGVVCVRDTTHIGCAGFHAARAVRHGMVGLVATNCGSQRIVRPPGGLAPMLGTNPLSVAAPVAGAPPFVLDMSTTVVPTGRVRAAARAGEAVPAGWLMGDGGGVVTDAAAFDRGEAHLRWLGGDPETGVYKGFGLGLMVEVLSALLSGAAFGPRPDTPGGTGTPAGRDDIGLFVCAIAPDVLRPVGEFTRDAGTLFTTLLGCPPVDAASPVRYPGWPEADRARRYTRDGIPLSHALFDELHAVAEAEGLPAPAVLAAA